MYITGVQFEKGSSATAFEQRMYGQELALCQRYYQLVAVGCYHFATASGQSLSINTPWMTTMRTTPSGSQKTSIAQSNVNTTYPPGDVILRADGSFLRVVSNGSGTVDYRAIWQFFAEL
jgi:hypothetical protein